MDPSTWPRSLDAAAAVVVERHAAAPAATVAAARRHSHGWQVVMGASGVLWTQPPPGEQQPPQAAPDTVFDLASVTKPTTALVFACCERAGLIRRQERLGDVLDELRDTPAGRAPFDLLMAHRAGLEAHEELFDRAPGATQRTPAEALARAASLARSGCEAPPTGEGYPPVYSDLGYMLTGAALERRSGRPLDALVAEHLGPLLPEGAVLGSARQLQQRSDTPPIAPTEDTAWRGGMIRGAVHDGNAWLIGGHASCGHAGLFGNAAAVVSLGMALLDALDDRRPAWLSAAQLAPLLRRRPGGSHCAGFDTRSGEAPSCGAHFGEQTFGHLGFTGTSLWIDPQQALVGVLLSNRVHPSREHIAIRRARPDAYDALYQLLLSS